MLTRRGCLYHRLDNRSRYAFETPFLSAFKAYMELPIFLAEVNCAYDAGGDGELFYFDLADGEATIVELINSLVNADGEWTVDNRSCVSLAYLRAVVSWNATWPKD